MAKLIALLLLIAINIHAACTDPSDYFSVVAPLVKAMNIDQKVGQMTQADVPQTFNQNKTVDPHFVSQYNLGSVLVAANGFAGEDGKVYQDIFNEDQILNATMTNWKTLASLLNQPTTVGNYKIYPLLGTDAVHGNQHVVGQPLFPQNIGMAASHNNQNFKNAGKHAAASVRESGWNFAFAPTVAVSHNYYWGRHYETLGSEHDNIRGYASSYVAGLQGDNGKGSWSGVCSSVKHYIGDGATYYGIDEGNNTVHSFKNFVDANFVGYSGGKDECMGNVMISYSATNAISSSISSAMVTGLLKNGIQDKQPWGGFTISDYDEISKVASQNMPTTNFDMTPYYAMVNMINAGVDMMMLAAPNAAFTPALFQKQVIQAVNEGGILMDRIDDAVTRILAVKCVMGLIDGLAGCSAPTNNTDYNLAQAQTDAMQAAKESLVLLKNNNNEVLPKPAEEVKYVVLTGERDMQQRLTTGNSFTNMTYCDYDNIGAQCGGWTVRWQGFNGNKFWQGENKKTSGATSILDAVMDAMPDATIFYNNYTDPTDMAAVAKTRQATLTSIANTKDMTAKNTIIIGVITENPYAEYNGDINNPFCNDPSRYDNNGCLYGGSVQNPYNPDAEKKNLALAYEQNSLDVIKAVQAKAQGTPLVTVLLSGRPMMVQSTIDMSDAFIAAWLPCTSGGEAILSSIVGDHLFRSGSTANSANTNSLPLDWLSTEDSLKNYPIYKAGDTYPSISKPLHPKGFGLATQHRSPDIDDDIDDKDDYSSSLTAGTSVLLMLVMWVFN